VPYGRWKSNKEVVEDVLKGITLDKPSKCIDNVFDIMQECWQQVCFIEVRCQTEFIKDPAKRPSFDSLVNKITAITQDENVGEQGYENVDESPKQHYDIPEYNNPNYSSTPF
jgi:hypothetical protein